MLRLALPANGDLDRDGLPLISRLTVLSAIHCSTGFTLDTSEVYISDINQRLRNARHVPKPWWRRWWRRVSEMGRAAGLRLNVGLSSRVELTGWWGRVRRAHSRAYPLSCFMATVLNGAWTFITASCHSEPSDSGRCRPKLSHRAVRCAFTRSSFIINLSPFVSRRPGHTPSVGQVQHIGSQTQLGSGIPMAPVWAEQRANTHELVVSAISFLCMSKSIFHTIVFMYDQLFPSS